MADIYNQPITAIFGSGNPSTGWTVDQDISNGIMLGLRAKNRASGDTSNLNGVYSYATAPATRGLWNYEFSISTAAGALSAFDYYLAADGDSSAGISYATVLPLTQWGDNSYGFGGTAQGAGVEPANLGEISAFPGLYSVAQNSQNITFGDYPGGGLSLAADATYSYQLYAVAAGAGENGTRLVDVGITVKVGHGGAAVPDSASTALLIGLGFSAIAWLRRRRSAAA